ncbi:TetR/AcrR family transcriptional regulator [Cohnella rhizosphaerae]|uniref:TetR/AcrR family transcriptional regulator n=1 Tax=Cohnella rhizosphaerae TaxID=1457232 RepID=A0A9X4KWW1_9BACL|nr:TetR/AcrR family transcriptional regulator [Cohnella rhizosphaerae]MDG0809709.1 TetR/AcrR family transcriptional regulator [Cohnella rhizosphaerae]
MSARKHQIIEAAMRCFARKGFHATSIQEIVDELGMAKGSIYFYFKGKEELLLAVIWHFVERMMAELAVLPEERQLGPREQFRLQLVRQFDYFRNNWEFLMMLMQEPQVNIGQEQKSKLLHELRSRLLLWKRQYIVAIYGEAASAYGQDGAHLLSGMLNEIMHACLLERRNIEGEQVGGYLLERLDDVMAGFAERRPAPLMDDDAKNEVDSEYVAALRAFVNDVEQSGEESLEPDRRSDLLEAAGRLIEEIGQPIPDRILTRSLYAYLKTICPPAGRDRLEAAGAMLKLEP